MKVKVKLYRVGTIFEERVIAKDYQDAKNVALARNPGATVTGVTAVFD